MSDNGKYPDGLFCLGVLPSGMLADTSRAHLLRCGLAAQVRHPSRGGSLSVGEDTIVLHRAGHRSQQCCSMPLQEGICNPTGLR